MAVKIKGHNASGNGKDGIFIGSDVDVDLENIITNDNKGVGLRIVGNKSPAKASSFKRLLDGIDRYFWAVLAGLTVLAVAAYFGFK